MREGNCVQYRRVQIAISKSFAGIEVDRVKEGGREPQPLASWAENTIITERAQK